MHVRATTGFAILLVLFEILHPLEAASPPSPGQAARVRAVLSRHCGACHGTQPKPKGGLGSITDLAHLVQRGQVVPGQPGRSPLWQRVHDEEMPPPGKHPPVSPTDRDLLRGWILAGAPLDTEVGKRQRVANLLPLIQADLESAPARERRFYRYVEAAHLATRPPAERTSLAQGMAKLVNSLSWHARLSIPEPLPGGLVWRLDLRHYRWTARQWDRLAALYPYVPLEPGDTARAVSALAGCDRPVVRADWFVAQASRASAYHDFLALPTSERTLERLLQVDATVNREERTAARAGFNDSGVARANRVLERQDALHGAYWHSYDFNDNTSRQNLFEFPLGPSPGPASFQHAGGEIIFHLPNGLQGYLLVDAAGTRIDRAPVEIVADPRRPDRIVENGLSCIGCHVSGILPRDDQVRAHVLKNPRAFPADLREEILTQYVPTRKLQALVREDNARFAAALARLGIRPADPEPVLTAVLRYEEVVDGRRAAEELGVADTELPALLERVPELRRTLGPLLANGSVQRQVFEAAYPRLITVIPVTLPLPRAGVSTFYRGHGRDVTALAWAPDGQSFATADSTGTVRVVDRMTGKARELGSHSEEVRTLAFAPDGRRLLSGGTDRVVRIWDLTSSNRLVRLVGHTAGVRAATFAPSGRWAITAGEDRAVRVWDLEGQRERLTLAGHAGTVNAVAVSADGQSILSGSSDRTVRLWNAETGERLGRFDHPGEVHSVAFAPSGGHIALGGTDGTVVLREPRTGKVLLHLGSLAGTPMALAFVRGELQVAVAGEGGEQPLRRYSYPGGKLQRSWGKGRIRVTASNREGEVLVGSGEEVHFEP